MTLPTSAVRFGLLTLLAFLLVGLAVVRPAGAIPNPNPQTAEEILEECLEKFEELTFDVEEALSDRAALAIADVLYLRSAGAPEKRVRKAARSGKKALSNLARGGLRELNRMTGTCMVRMRQRGSDRTLNNTLLMARAEAMRDFRAALKAEAARIDAAVAGELPEPEEESTPEDFQGTPL